MPVFTTVDVAIQNIVLSDTLLNTQWKHVLNKSIFIKKKSTIIVCGLSETGCK